MSGQRPLLPKPAVVGEGRTVDASPVDAEGPVASQQGGAKERRHRHTAQEWQDVKESFEALYCQEDTSLDYVKQEMKRLGDRQYKNKIKEWGLKKYIKAPDMQILLAKRDKRTRDRGVGTVFVVNDVELKEDRLNRFGKRLLASDYVSPSTSTPAGVYYYTPQSTIDAESPHVDTDDVFILQNAHHFRRIAHIATVQSSYDPIQTRVTSLAHAHQAAEQGIACLGRFTGGDMATRLLWQARNFAIGSAKIMQEPGAAGASVQAQWADRPLAPQFWVSPQAPEGPGRERVQRLVEYVKKAMLCQRLIGIGRQDSSRWRGDWRLMNETEIFNVETAGRLTFGNPSLPYPRMEIFTLWVKFDRSTAKTSSSLLRVCFCIDPDEERQNCKCCHSTCLVLDYMDPEGAVKLNIPLSGSDQKPFEWARFQHEVRARRRTIESTWRDVNYIYQGMTLVAFNCKKHKKAKTNARIHFGYNSEEESEQEIWDAEGGSDTTLFEPFPPPGISLICPDSSSLLAAEEWDSEEDPLISDEEDFEPFAAD